MPRPPKAPPPGKPAPEPPKSTHLGLAVWTKLIEAYRLAPGAHLDVAKGCGVNYRTARKAWTEGLTIRAEGGHPEKRGPISELIAGEREGARAVQQAAATTGAPVASVAMAVAQAMPRVVSSANVRDLAGAGRLSTHAQEAQLVEDQRLNVRGLVGAGNNVAAGLLRMSLRLKTALERFTVKELASADELLEYLAIMERGARTLALIDTNVRGILEAERIVNGSPAGKPGETAPTQDAGALQAVEDEATAELARLLPFITKHTARVEVVEAPQDGAGATTPAEVVEEQGR